MLTITLIIIFLGGITLIALEDKTGINKSAIALLMSVVLWTLISLTGADVNATIVAEQLGEVSETLFFVMGALLIVELIDAHGGFSVIHNAISTTSQRKFLWIVTIITFLLSALLDNIATAVIMVALVRKFTTDKPLLWLYSCAIILAANAGGAFSPVGDVTTILLWTGGNLSPLHQISHLLLPSLISLVVATSLVSVLYLKKSATLPPMPQDPSVSLPSHITTFHRRMILILGISTMALVPVFQEWSTLPPFMRIIMGVAILWIYTDCMYGRMGGIPTSQRHTVSTIFARLDMSTIMFFLGILMSVAALKVGGVLAVVGDGLQAHISDPLLICSTIGVMSSFVDNVALVAATQGMYPLMQAGEYAQNSEFWTFLAYCAVNGGSLLIIGSATGVTVMGMEKISFGYYLRRFSLLALISFLAGAGFLMLHF